MTNHERIKQMTVEELEDFLCGLVANTIFAVTNGVELQSPNAKWLNSEVTE